MSCPACSHRLLGLLAQIARNYPAALRSHSRRLPNNALRQNRLRALSTRPALRFTGSTRFLDLKNIGGAEENSNAAIKSIPNPEPRVEPAAPANVAEELASSARDADPDPADLRKDIGLTPHEEDVQARLSRLTGGASGTQPPEAKAKKRDQNAALAGPVTKMVAKDVMKMRSKTDQTKADAQRDRGGTTKMDREKKKAPWMVQKEALKEKFGKEGWQPRKKLSPDAMDGIRQLHASDPDTYTTPVLANEFKVSPEAIRRILKSKWRPKEEEAEKRAQRWEKRGEQIWKSQVEKGIKPPKKWRVKGVGSVKGGKDEVPKWKWKPGGRDQGGQKRDRFGEFTRPRGGSTSYGDEGGWDDRIL
ncbi:Neugrin-related protein [Macrophomina phaseolina MS6]|uniref:Required for respiratory growth protein 9, mitochondrial n=2 Tax=Macrophomina phaseolina TaxID=35725 RepID=K2R963_MACPH|nr:Neugrin-related protein [Macrophomina phaseolina MS6]